MDHVTKPNKYIKKSKHSAYSDVFPWQQQSLLTDVG